MKKIVRLTETELNRLIKKIINESDENDKEKFEKIVEELFPYKSLGLEHYEIFNKEDEDELEFDLESGSMNKDDVCDKIKNFFEEEFPNFDVNCFFYHGNDKLGITLNSDDYNLEVDLDYDLPSYDSDKYS